MSRGEVIGMRNGAYHFLAADERRPVKMADLILGTNSELRKAGKRCAESDFGPYYE